METRHASPIVTLNTQVSPLHLCLNSIPSMPRKSTSDREPLFPETFGGETIFFFIIFLPSSHFHLFGNALKFPPFCFI